MARATKVGARLDQVDKCPGGFEADIVLLDAHGGQRGGKAIDEGHVIVAGDGDVAWAIEAVPAQRPYGANRQPVIRGNERGERLLASEQNFRLFVGGAEIPQDRLGVAGEKREAAELVALPFADLGGGDVADVVDVKEQQRAAPKARRVASERNIDLAALIAQGISQPIHVKDLDALPAAANQARIGTGLSLITARCSSAAFRGLIDQFGTALEPHVLVAGFCAASLRAVTQAESIVVSVEIGLGVRRVAYRDPDFSRASRPRLAGGDATPSLILRDFTQSRITGIAISNDPVPAITIGQGEDFFELCLAFREEQLSGNAAILLLSSLADRMEQNPSTA